MCLCPADFDSITDPIMKAKMVALKGINKVMTQGNLGLTPMVINRSDTFRETCWFFISCPTNFVSVFFRFQQPPVAQVVPVVPVAPGPEGPQLLGQVCRTMTIAQ